MNRFQLSNSEIVADIVDKSAPVTTVVFDARMPGTPIQPLERKGWGAKFIEPLPINSVFLKPASNAWYRQPDEIELILSIQTLSVIKNSKKIRLLGNSMGGFAALTFSAALGASETLSINPQSTLNRSQLSHEPRFDEARCYDWHSEYADAKYSASVTARHHIVYDPFFPMDSQHVKRLSSLDLQLIHTPFIQHQIPHWLAATKLLKPLMISFLLDGVVPNDYQKRLRKSLRNYLRYYSGMARQAYDRNKISILDKMVTQKESILRAIELPNIEFDTKKDLIDLLNRK